MTTWIVLSADRGAELATTIIGATEWDGYVPEPDEVLYQNPVNAAGQRVDAGWKVSGAVSLAADVYTYTDHAAEPALEVKQRRQIHEAYLYWRIFGRTEHWAGLRLKILHGGTETNANEIDPDQRNAPLEATDQWAVHIEALIDQAIHGAFPISGPLSADDLQALIDHADNIFRTLGPTWYGAQQNAEGHTTEQADQYRAMNITAGSAIYTDICTALGVLRTIDGAFNSMVTLIRVGFDPESPTLGN